jgi:hypothetical protein
MRSCCYLRVCLCIPTLSLLSNGSVETSPRQRIHTQHWKNCWTRRFQCGPRRIKESRRLVLPITSCYSIDYWGVSLKFVDSFEFGLKSDPHNGHFTRDLCAFVRPFPMQIARYLSELKLFPQKLYRWVKYLFCVKYTFTVNLPVFETIKQKRANTPILLLSGYIILYFSILLH